MTSVPAVDPRSVFSIDVECVACGQGHLARSVAQIALVDCWEQVILNVYVLPEQPIVSCLTPLTGLTEDLLRTHGTSLPQALQMLRQALPQHAVLVGQGISHDVQWVTLQEGSDFQSMMDLAGLYRVWNDRYKSWSVWSQDYLCKQLLQWDTTQQTHNAALDAVKSIRLYNHWVALQANPSAWKQAQETLLAGTPEPSFAKRNATFEGVCMGNRKTCSCGDPFFT
mmetsp:Transcript_13590/g.41079  ORF Transcript_13590/g.41079 Transcript_13590/m.41079 type:complete len:225 (-) Transcript_13590:305-979(-)|eukprot:CAMPEP_0206151082 /NCGR_PEP_ID=MMETSP1473-20131121/38638_1 /ASSEMBLY_ACC=CAM_ASM_001109 /TAXON_ID=1461547 /ORGANISM="Stichococcus sp, Strain RCC1054" /LENGTH=224 /DNA_ID=CAMNT_0053548619 /DNA_START=1660 /DNA_END=2334 /DNA_ORIENTATION=-